MFFREEPLPDPTLGPRGAQGVPLTPGRSIAVDPQSVPYGTPVWLDTTEPLSSTPLRRLVMAQDTGSAIIGAVRADYFWGWGEAAEAAGRPHEAAAADVGVVAKVSRAHQALPPGHPAAHGRCRPCTRPLPTRAKNGAAANRHGQGAPEPSAATVRLRPCALAS